jgi:FkbH-like protein
MSPRDMPGGKTELPYADLLLRWLHTGDDAYRDLYRAALVRRILSGSPDDPGQLADIVLAQLEHHRPSANERLRVSRLLGQLHATVPRTTESFQKVRILFIGDCLFEEVALFLTSACLDDGILISADHITSKNPAEQIEQIRARSHSTYDAIFFGPFSYAFNPYYAALMELSNAVASRSTIAALAGDAIGTTSAVIDLLTSTFDVPIFVNNCSSVHRGTTATARWIKTAVTARTRRHVRRRLNSWLAQFITDKNRDAAWPLLILDETCLAESPYAPLDLGAYYLTYESIHPTVFSRRLAGEIAERVRAIRLLHTKLIITDLDNTLWAGVIGEDSRVAHHHPRQRILRQLKDKGVVLAISSKNDPSRVHWTGATLESNCFVASEINWEAKTASIERILRDLNIRATDALFLDDRPDERALVQARWPMIRCCDPNDHRTWKRFDTWSELLPKDTEFDRTAMYQQRKGRAASVAATSTIANSGELLRQLELIATLVIPDRKALKRAHELINRTNQWNLCGTRTTLRALQEWRDAVDHRLLIIQLQDKFGSMGTVCVVVARETSDAIEIPVFVLSCRVFGFGVETLVLDYLKRCSVSVLGSAHLRGFCRNTGSNGPALNMYRDHGFVGDGEVWTYVGTPGERVVPTWISPQGFTTPSARRPITSFSENEFV